MAVVQITEFIGMMKDQSGNAMQVPQAPPVAEQAEITIGVGSVQSAAFNAKTTLIRVHATGICCLAFGENPTAAAGKNRFAADQTEYFAVYPGQKLAVITSA